jgi:hypothetical protein
MAAARLDLLMLVLTPCGRERTASEFGQLLRAAGFELHRVISTQSQLSILESFPT